MQPMGRGGGVRPGAGPARIGGNSVGRGESEGPRLIDRRPRVRSSPGRWLPRLVRSGRSTRAEPTPAGGPVARAPAAASGARSQSLYLSSRPALPAASDRRDVSAPRGHLPSPATPRSLRRRWLLSDAGLKGRRGGSEARPPAHAATRGPAQPPRPRRRPRRSARDLHGRAWA